MNPASATVHHPMKMRGLDRVREGKLNESSDYRGQPGGVGTAAERRGKKEQRTTPWSE